jgi:hypothetical protein
MTSKGGVVGVSERRDDDEDLFGEDEADPIEETHPGFTITCEECGSTLVAVESDLEFSPAAGRRGNVYLRCTECDAETFLLPRGEDDEEGER